MNGDNKKDPSGEERSINFKRKAIYDDCQPSLEERIEAINTELEIDILKLQELNEKLAKINNQLKAKRIVADGFKGAGINPWSNPEGHAGWMSQQESQWLNSFGD